MSSAPPQKSDDNGSSFKAGHPLPPDLTPYISKVDGQYVAGGAFGDVYRCRYTRGPISKEVAVKALRFRVEINGDRGDKHVKMIRRELGIWKRLDHINVVPFLGIAYGFGMKDATSLVSLWMPNGSLHNFLANHDNDIEVVHRLQFLLNIANGLHYLHSIPIVHGDLNPANVFLDASYTARLADFGYASFVGNIPEGLSYLQRSTTRPGALRWSAPEQLELEEMPAETSTRTTKSDIYSFGCVMLQVLSGKQPWSEFREDAAITLRLAWGQRPSRPESRMMDDAYWHFIQYCWSPPEERPAAGVIISTIRRFLRRYPPTPPLCSLLVSQSSRADSFVDTPSLPLRQAAEESLPDPGSPRPQSRTTSIPTRIDSDNKTASHTCRWEIEDGTICGEEITWQDTAHHLKTVHDLKNMTRDFRMQCGWPGCGRMVKRESVLRHVREIHLGYRRRHHQPYSGDKSAL